MFAMRGEPWLAVSVVLLYVAACFVVSNWQFGDRPTALLTSPHAEFAPFQRVWNPDTNNAHVVDEFPESESDDGPVMDTLCGTDGTQCPPIPAFSGEDYFDNKPLGCCNTPEQQAVWSKWVALKDRVAKLEGTYVALQHRKHDVNINYKLSTSATGRPGSPGPMGADGEAGPQGPRASDAMRVANAGALSLLPVTTPGAQSPPIVQEVESNTAQVSTLEKQVAMEWQAILALQAELNSKTPPAAAPLPAAAAAAPKPVVAAVTPAAAAAAAAAPVAAPRVSADAKARLLEDERRLREDIEDVKADESRMAAAPAAAAAPVAAAAAAAAPASAEKEEEGYDNLGTLGSVPSVPLTGETGQDEATPAAAAVATAAAPRRAAAPAVAPATKKLVAAAAAAKAAAAPSSSSAAAAGGEGDDALPALGSFELAKFANNIESGGGDLGTNVVWMYKDLAKRGNYKAVEDMDGSEERKYGDEYAAAPNRAPPALLARL